EFTTKRPSDPLYLPTSMELLTVNEGPSMTREARLLPPSPILKRVTSTFVWARITWLGFSRVPLIRASVVRAGSVPPHMAAFSQAPPPPFHSAVVPAHDAVALAMATSPTTSGIRHRRAISFILGPLWNAALGCQPEPLELNRCIAAHRNWGEQPDSHRHKPLHGA